MSSPNYDELMTELKKVRSTVERFDLALIGDETRGIKGVVHTIEDHSRRIKRIEYLAVAVLMLLIANIPSIWPSILKIL